MNEEWLKLPRDELIELLRKAQSFYEGSPDGQYDEIAAFGIKYMLKELESVTV